MSNMNGMGPRDKGPMTGRGFGLCSKGSQAGRYIRGGCGRGKGFGFWRKSFSVQDEIQSLENEEKILEEELETIRSRKESLIGGE